MGLFHICKAGDLVRTSGVYAVLHSTPHKLVERVIYVEGERFRRCGLCPLGVLYRLDEPGVPMTSNTNLAKEELELI